MAERLAWRGWSGPTDGSPLPHADVVVLGTRPLGLSVQGDVVRATLDNGAPVPFLPPARVGASVRRDDGRWTAGAAVRHALRQHRVAPADEEPVDAWTLIDLDAGIRFIRAGQVHSFTLRAEHVMDTLYRDAASRIKHFAPNPGRNVSVLYRLWF